MLTKPLQPFLRFNQLNRVSALAYVINEFKFQPFLRFNTTFILALLAIARKLGFNPS